MKKILLIILLIFMSLSGQAMAATVNQLMPITVQSTGGTALIGISRPQWTDAVVLVAGVARTYTIPSGATLILFSASMGMDFYVNYTTTATIPGASTSNGTSNELNPTLRTLGGAASISLISPTSGVVTVSLYK